MPYQFSFDIQSDTQSHKVASSHFGLNFVADFERIGSKGWESFDEVVESMGVTNIRYPGGVTAEKGFDITDPNASTIALSDGSSRRMLGAYDFGSFCVDHGYSASYIIPTNQLLVTDKTSGRLVFDPAYEQYIIEFVFGTMLATSGTVSMFEIGNEYESYMTSQEYGALVDALAPLIQAGIDLYAASYGPLESEPNIAIQVWSQNANETGTLNTEDLAKRADAVFSQLTSTSADLIDTAVTHWYLKDKAKTYEEVYAAIESDIQDSIAILHAQSDLFGGDIGLVVSEYNVNHNEVQFFGMAQVPVLIKMFAEFVQTGVNQLDFWSAQYHATSFALDDGTLTAVGAAVSYLSAVLPGKEPIDVATGSASIGAVFFGGDEVSVLTVSSISPNQQDFSFVLSQPGTCYSVGAIGYLTVDSSRANGAFGSFTGLASYNEPDLAGEIVWIDPVQFLNEVSISLEAFQTVFIEVVDIAPDLEADLGGLQYYNFQHSPNGVSVWLSEGYISSGSFGGSFLFDRELKIEGTAYSDWIIVNSGYADVSTGGGDDFVEAYGNAYGSFALKDGDDSAVIFSMNTFVHGGKGNDAISVYGNSAVIQGGQGNDLIAAEASNITIVYGISDGDDTVTSSHFDTLTLDLGENAELDFQSGRFQVYETSGNAVLEFLNGGSITFVGLSQEALMANIDGYHGNNVLVASVKSGKLLGYEGNDSLYGGDGNDFLDGGPNGDLLEGGLGNDTYVVDDFWDVVVGETTTDQGGGFDIVDSWVSFRLPSNVEVLRLQGTADINGVGTDGADTLVGNAGENILEGGRGKDWIDGGSGNDVLVGGAGADTLIGGGWADTFFYYTAAESAARTGRSDLIIGFEPGADLIDLSSIDANRHVQGNQSFEFVGDADFSSLAAASAGELRMIQLAGGDFLIEADTNGDGAAEFQIRLTDSAGITSSDFIF